MQERPQKITFAEMRSAGVHGVLIYCADLLSAATTHRYGGPMGEWRLPLCRELRAAGYEVDFNKVL